MGAVGAVGAAGAGALGCGYSRVRQHMVRGSVSPPVCQHSPAQHSSFLPRLCAASSIRAFYRRLRGFTPMWQQCRLPHCLNHQHANPKLALGAPGCSLRLARAFPGAVVLPVGTRLGPGTEQVAGCWLGAGRSLINPPGRAGRAQRCGRVAGKWPGAFCSRRPVGLTPSPRGCCSSPSPWRRGGLGPR